MGKQTVWALILILLFCLTTPSLLLAASPEPVLTISGDGVEQELSFTLAQLEGMHDSISQNVYSAWNTWPTRSLLYARGVSLQDLLKRAGLKPEAKMINIAEKAPENGSVGYNMSFLLSDLLAERYTFEGRKTPVDAILAFSQSDKGFSSLEKEPLRLIYGQLAAQEQTAMGFVKSVYSIKVSCDTPKELSLPEANLEKQPDGRYAITLSHDNTNAKIYYTTDDSVPTVQDRMYNSSAPHWQPHLNVPFHVEAHTTVKAVAIATGYQNSPVLELIPEPPAPQPQLNQRTSAEDSTTSTGTGDSAAPTSITVLLDGKALSFGEVSPQIINNRILVPLRAVFEAMGAVVDWDTASGTATAVKGNTTVVLTIGDPLPTINGAALPEPLDQPGLLQDGRTLAPLRFVAEAFGGHVDWDAITLTASIQS